MQWRCKMGGGVVAALGGTWTMNKKYRPVFFRVERETLTSIQHICKLWIKYCSSDGALSLGPVLLEPDLHIEYKCESANICVSIFYATECPTLVRRK